MHAAPDRRSSLPAAPLVVEVVGTPGAGKTTLVAGLLPVLDASGHRARGVLEASREIVGRGRIGALLGRALPARVASAAAWRVFAVARLTAAGRYLAAHPRLVRLLWETQRHRPAEADAGRRKVVHWYVRMLGARCYLVRRPQPGEALVFDEGMVHRVVQLFASPVERPDAARIAAYLAQVPPPDLLLHVHAPTATCFERVEARGRWEALAGRDATDVATFVDNAGHAVALAVAEARRLGWRVVEIDNSAPSPEAALVALARDVPAALAEHRSASAVPLVRPGRARVQLPRPGRMLHTARIQLQPMPIPRADIDTVLGRYGLHAQGRPTVLTTGWRNANVAVRTSAGELVLRRHRDGWAREAVEHEHSILAELTRQGVAVPRLRHTVEGTTMVDHAGRIHALFVREAGENLAGMRLSTPQRAGLVHEAGRVLARLHVALVDFTPAGRHHLTDDLTDGSDTGLADGVEAGAFGAGAFGAGAFGAGAFEASALDRLAADSPVPSDADAAAALRTLRSRAAAIDERLATLGEQLHGAELPRTVIHGDYGVHNLLYRADGSALVLDFELARRGRRLVDLVNILLRCTPDDARALFAGYGELVTMTDDELALLPAFWEHHWLTAALRSWRNHYELGGTKRLRTALRRLEQADRLPPIGQVPIGQAPTGQVPSRPVVA